MTRAIRVRTASTDYRVLCGRGVAARAGRLVRRLGPATGIFILTSPRVWRRCGRQLARTFPGAPVIRFDDAERAKRLATVEHVCRRLVRAGADRGAILVAVGGGVVGDLAGFTAASYLRGVRVVQVPTTLVAQVDAAIGGKTGVNLPEGKNLVGAFWQPALVLADPALLGSLPERDYRAGLYEIIKCAVIADPALFGFLDRRLDALLRRDTGALEWATARAAAVKARIVSRDEREADRRRILNFGHTAGHALEAATGYRRFRHGEAVAWGMLVALALALRLGRIRGAEAARIAELIRRVGAVPRLPAIPRARFLRALAADKKSRGGRLHFVLPRRVGAVEIRNDVTAAMVYDALEALRRG
jgi:3-dehydroquinate synthase